MSNEVEHATGVVTYWKELTLLFITILGFLGLIRKKQAGSMLVTREYLDTKLDLQAANIALSVNTTVSESAAKVNERIDECRTEVDRKLSVVHSRIDGKRDKDQP